MITVPIHAIFQKLAKLNDIMQQCHFIVFQESASSFNDSKLQKTFVISVSSAGLGCLKPDEVNFVTFW